MTNLVTGASGFLGSYIVSEARKMHRPVRGMIRPTSYRGALNIEGEHIVFGDVTNVASMVAAMEGCRAVIHCAAVITETVPDEAVSWQTNVQGTENVIQACQQAGVRRLIHISTQGATETNTGVYGRTKREADKRVQASDLDWTILKPALIYGPGTQGLFAKITRLVNKLPILPVIGTGKEELRPVLLHDVCQAVFSCLDSDNSIGKIYDIGGQDVVSFNAFVQAICAAQDKPAKRLVHIPIWLCQILARTLALVMQNPPINTDNLINLKQAKSFSITPAKEAFGYTPLSLEAGLRQTFQPRQRRYPAGQNPCKQVAIVGLGKIGIMHASMISVVPNARVAALVDRQESQGKYIRSMGLRAPFFTDLQEAIEQVELDAVMICTPQFAHRPVAEVAVNAGLHVFCEKPLAHTLQDAQSMVDLVSRHPDTRHAVGYMMGHLPLYQRAKELLQAQVLGPLQQAEATCYLSQVFHPSQAWFYKKQLAGGGLVINVASHLLYLVYLLFGEVQCSAAAIQSIHSVEVEDEATALYRSAAGCDITVKTSWSVPGYPLQYCGINVVGENGSLQVDERWLVLELHTATVEFPRGTTRIHQSALESASFNLSPDYAGEAYYREDREFVEAMQASRRPSITWQDGLAVQRMIEQLYMASGVKNTL
jgi:predicted dehydrogenase/nucleoside-diphosphate-sugar epimerase